MKNLQGNFLQITLLVALLLSSQSQTLVKINDSCGCEELQLEAECETVEKCTFQNKKCSTLDCKRITSIKGCKQNKKCAWNNEKCDDFTSCKSYNITTQSACDNLFHSCGFNKTDSTCGGPYAPIPLPSCSYNTFMCTIGKEGWCIMKNNQCQEWKVCEDSGDSLACLMAYPACSWDPIKAKCNSVMTCKDAGPNLCLFAKRTINGDDMYLCEGCSDFNPATQKSENCFINSLWYYHWNNGNCTACTGGSSYSQLISFVAIYLITASWA